MQLSDDGGHPTAATAGTTTVASLLYLVISDNISLQNKAL